MNKTVVVFGIIIWICLIVVVLFKYNLISKLTAKLNFFQLFNLELEIEKSENTKV